MLCRFFRGFSQVKWAAFDSRMEKCGLVNRVPMVIGYGNHERDSPKTGGYYDTSTDSGG